MVLRGMRAKKSHVPGLKEVRNVNGSIRILSPFRLYTRPQRGGGREGTAALASTVPVLGQQSSGCVRRKSRVLPDTV